MNDPQRNVQFTEQQKKALDLQRNLIVTAGAGSGKTTILVERYLRILLDQRDVSLQNILAITFTEKAASEMKQRIVEKIYDHFQNQPEKSTTRLVEQERLFPLIKNISQIQISTIHAFCRNVLNAHFTQTALNPDFQIAQPPEIENMLNRIFWQFFLSIPLGSGDAYDLSRAALRELELPKIKDIFFKTYEKRTILAEHISRYALQNPQDLIAEWEVLKSDHYRSLLTPFISDAEVIRNLGILKNGLRMGGQTAQQLNDAVQNILNMPVDAIDEKVSGALELLDQLYTKKGEVRKPTKNAIEKCDAAVQSAYAILMEKSRALPNGIISEDEIANETEGKQYATIICGLSRLLDDFLEKVEREKQSRQMVDFDDLLLMTRDLLQNSPGILSELQQRYKWILVDEFQDTDAVQSEIIQMLGTDQNDTFFVGDPKQSIYSFRQADVSIFQEQLQRIQSQPPQKIPFTDAETNRILFSTDTENRGIIELPDNFRSRESLIQFYNHLFEKVLARESEFDVDFKPLAFPGSAKRKGSSLIELHLINCESKLKIDEYVPFEILHVIDIIQAIVGKQKKYDPQTQDWELVDYKDIAILTRDRTQWTELTRDLQLAGIPFETYQGSGFFQAQEVQDIYYLLKAVSDPEDNFALIAALRSPYIGVSDAGLFYLSRCIGKNYSERIQSMYAYLQGATIEKSFEEKFSNFLHEKKLPLEINSDDRDALMWAAELFPRWHLAAHRGEYSLLLNEIIDTLNITAVLQADEFGEQKAANLNKLIQFAYKYEQENSGRITDFLDIFAGLMRGTVREGEAPVYFEGGNQVAILTIHGAKGLEFPVVILPFLEKRFRTDENIYHHKNKGLFFKTQDNARPKSFIGNYFKTINKLQTAAEEKRLLYVAATRARDHLFFIGANGVQNQSKRSYLNFLLNALELDPVSEQPSERTLTEKVGFRIIRREIGEDSETPQFSKTEIKVEAEEESKLPDKDILQKYSAPLHLPIETGEYTVTQLMIYEENPERYVHYHYFKDGAIYPPNLQEEYSDEPGGMWWGTLVHRALENFHQRSASEDEIFNEKLVNQFGIPAEDIPKLKMELKKMLQQFRQTSMGNYLLHCEQRSEVRAACKFPCGTLLGIMDRIFKNEDGMWEVLDFKTNRISEAELSSLIKKYTAQVSYYALLLANLFPQQKTYPVRLYFLAIDEEYKKEFGSTEIDEIRPKAEVTIREIQKVEEEFFGIGELNTEAHRNY